MTTRYRQQSLGDGRPAPVGLPLDHEPVRPAHFAPERIVLAAGSLTTREQREFVERICALYPDAERVEQPNVPHNRVELGEPDPLRRMLAGKRTLVFGEHRSAVRFSEEEGNTCPNYWHFSLYGHCPYGCRYCYLAGTPGVWFSPTVKIFGNLGEIVGRMDRVARRAGVPTAFYHGKLQDGLALDPLTGYSRVLVPWFARHPFARQIVLTKSAQADALLGLEHGGRTILSWSVNPPEVVPQFGENVPGVGERLDAMRRCADAAYPVRAVLMPIVPVEGWAEIYGRFVGRLVAEVPVQRLTLGGICSYRGARGLMERRLGADNIISRHVAAGGESPDGRARYAEGLRVEMYARLLRVAREARPDVELALCLEEPSVWRAVNLESRLGRCNCVL